MDLILTEEYFFCTDSSPENCTYAEIHWISPAAGEMSQNIKSKPDFNQCTERSSFIIA
jgi:hypothetical protein